MSDWDRSAQYEACLTVASFCVWVANALAEGRDLPHLTATLPQEWALAAQALHGEDRFTKDGRRLRLRRETNYGHSRTVQAH